MDYLVPIFRNVIDELLLIIEIGIPAPVQDIDFWKLYILLPYAYRFFIAVVALEVKGEVHLQNTLKICHCLYIC
ncbi:hypothetical protein EL17_23525 [Anditalea andensis]|uniref:Uncharacterized protein n=1 Tax=Anditalea andensis TaxID=1048983 RepID=A0A074LCZ5_9BACT|nr:hypothetical protein EL17_23525 [Anditalea andensis]